MHTLTHMLHTYAARQAQYGRVLEKDGRFLMFTVRPILPERQSRAPLPLSRAQSPDPRGERVIRGRGGGVTWHACCRALRARPAYSYRP